MPMAPVSVPVGVVAQSTGLPSPARRGATIDPCQPAVAPVGCTLAVELRLRPRRTVACCNHRPLAPDELTAILRLRPISSPRARPQRAVPGRGPASPLDE